jgi:NAD(P)H-dependent flavin oxidoreductase YrpB (nitropropane dioxygenase family)
LPLYSGERCRRAYEQGNDIDEALIGCGEVVGLITKVVSVKEVIDEIVTGARAIYKNLKP